MLTQAGSPQPQGAIWDGHGTNFAVWSAHASAIELCLFDGGDAHETRIELQRSEGGVFHAYLPGVGPGQRYGYRAHGPYAPALGHRFNPHKLLIDPYARAIERPTLWNELHNGVDPLDPERADLRDSASVVPRCVVIDDDFDWRDDRPPNVPLHETLIYECHVKGMTALHPEVPPALRGRYLGLACEALIAHLRSLSVTAVELLPIQQAYSEAPLVQRGQINYWGYNTIGFFAPDARFAVGSEGHSQVREFKTMVRALHRAGIEVILDVVYNHTGEGDERGPTVSLRGLDNASYYRLDPNDPSRYWDVTGCGNTLDLEHPQALRLTADSLRYWVEEMHVDGFRFDLAPALARRLDGTPGMYQGLFALIAQDPVLSGVKLIVEPWDVGASGYQLGAFPPGYREWNNRYRDCVRRFFRGDPGQLGELATRISGSSDVFAGSRRMPQSSVNFVACHDGFTLRDLTSYERKHNLPNGWNNTDGNDDNASRNFGVEGETDRSDVNELRWRMLRSLIATVACSLGTPMLYMGDELGRTQLGNNNAYCIDDPSNWVDWSLAPFQLDLLAFARRCFAVRRERGVFRRSAYFSGARLAGFTHKDVSWLGPDGQELDAAAWGDPQRRALCMWVCGHDSTGRPDPTQPSLLFALNGGEQPQPFRLPVPAASPRGYRVLLDSERSAREGSFTGAAGFILAAHAVCLLEADGAGAAEG